MWLSKLQGRELSLEWRLNCSIFLFLSLSGSMFVQGSQEKAAPGDWSPLTLGFIAAYFVFKSLDTSGFAEEPPTLSVITSSLKIYWEPCLYCYNLELQSATELVETLCPKADVLLTSRGEIKLSLPISSMQCCATVQATYTKQQKPQLWMKGSGEGGGFFCSL